MKNPLQETAVRNSPSWPAYEHTVPAADPAGANAGLAIAATVPNKSITELALQALPAQGVTFKSVTVPAANTKSDSLIVASAAQALTAPAPAQKLQKRLNCAGTGGGRQRAD